MRSTLRLVVLSCALGGLLLGGCQRTWVYRPDQLPPIRSGVLEAPLSVGDRPKEWPIESVRITRRDAPDQPVQPTQEELRAMVEGRQPPGVESVEVGVDTSGVVWRDYAAPGALIGALLGFAVGFLVLSKEEAGLDTQDQVGLSALMGLGFSIYGAGIGGGIGGWKTSGRSDRRLDPLSGPQVFPLAAPQLPPVVVEEEVEPLLEPPKVLEEAPEEE